MLDTLLHTKLSVPPVRSDLVTRPRLVDLLREGLNRPLTLISAPAGFGKTTLVGEWYAADAGRDFQVAWLSLDADDNNPTRFLSYVVAALQTVSPAIDGGLSIIFQSPQPPPAKAILTTPLNRLSGLDFRVAFVLGDYHLITARGVHEAVVFLLDHLPPQLRLIITSRIDPPLPLARLRAHNQLAEIRAHDLRFTHDEASRFLMQMFGLELPPHEVAALEARTEGWIAGLQMAALAMKGHSNVSGFVAAFAGNHRFILDYLVEEVLSRQSNAVQTFLLETAILDRLCAPLCAAVAGQAGARATLEYLERANVFLTAVDGEGQWYRYHPLFAEALRHRLSQAEPDRLPELHRCASQWLEQNGLVQEAIVHALDAADFERAARLIEPIAFRSLLPAQAQALCGWLAMFPDGILRSHPNLFVIYGAALHLTNHAEDAEARLQAAEVSVRDGMASEPVRLILGRSAAVRSNLCRVAGNLIESVAFAHRALELLPESDFMAVIATLNANYAHLDSGNVTSTTEAETLAVVARVWATGNLFTYLRSITHLGWLYMMQGKLRKAAETYDEAVRTATDQGGLEALAASPAYYIGLGDLFYHRNELKAAQTHLLRGLELVNGMRVLDVDIVTLAHLIMARFKLGTGDYEGTEAVASQFLDIAREHNFPPSRVAQGTAVYAGLALRQGDLQTAVQWALASGLQSDDALRYPREREYLILVRVWIAQWLNDPTHYGLKSARHLLGRLLESAETDGRMASVIELLILQALAANAEGNTSTALDALDRALNLAEPEGYIRLFVDEGAPMAALLREAAGSGIAPGQVARLLYAFGDDGAVPVSAADPRVASTDLLGDALTERELEVLRLIADGASNWDIAQALVVSLGTVKKHINNIFSKLDVQSRTQAVAAARILDLL